MNCLVDLRHQLCPQKQKIFHKFLTFTRSYVQFTQNFEQNFGTIELQKFWSVQHWPEVFVTPTVGSDFKYEIVAEHSWPGELYFSKRIDLFSAQHKTFILLELILVEPYPNSTQTRPLRTKDRPYIKLLNQSYQLMYYVSSALLQKFLLQDISTTTINLSTSSSDSSREFQHL